MIFFKRFSLFLSLVIHTGTSVNALQISNITFSTIAAINPSLPSTFLNPEGYKELNYDGMVGTLNRCETPFGAWALREMLTHPLTSLEDLMQRQEALKILIYNTQTFEEYKSFVQKINKPQLLHYWQISNKLHQDTQELYYDFFGLFPKISGYLNSSKIALSLSGNVNSALTILGYLGKQCFGSYVKEAMFASRHNVDADYIQAMKDGFYYPIHLHNPFQSYFHNNSLQDFSFFFDSHKMSGGDFKIYIESFINNKNLISVAPLLAILGTGAAIATYDYLTVQDISNYGIKIKNTYKTTTDLKVEIHHIAQWYAGCTLLYNFSQKNQAFSELPPFQVIKKYIHQKDISPELKKLFELLDSSELKNSTATSISSGTALLTHKLLVEIKDELIPLMKALGECDALLSIAKLYLEQLDNGTHYCLPEFNQDNVCVQFINFWHPGVTSKNRVTNTVYLGNNNPRNMIITGPNGGGKSTAMAAISWGIILAQGWGIVPSEKATMQIFTGLRTYLSPQADLEQGMSTFMAEKRRLDTMISTIDKLKSTDAYFFIIDEPCRGTIERVAEQFVIQLCNKLAQSDTCISVLATHLEKPIFLAQQNAQYVNHQMELQDSGQGFIRTFKLLPGAADWWFNDEPKRTRFLLEL